MGSFQLRTRPLNRAEAWGCLLMNLAVCPGMGTLLAGKKTGFIQLIGAAAGAGVALIGAFAFLSGLPFSPPNQLLSTKPVLFGIGGMALFLGCWLWGIVTGIRLLLSSPA